MHQMIDDLIVCWEVKKIYGYKDTFDKIVMVKLGYPYATYADCFKS